MVKHSVCIIGAGPGGLVSAKVLLQSGQFEVTIFEKNTRIGGIWAIDNDTKEGFLSPWTPTNLSRFQVALSDHAWTSVDLDDGSGRTTAVPLFPQAWQVNRYLEAYRQKHIPDTAIRLGHEVLAVERQNDRWEVSTKSTTGESRQSFDFLVMASGFFAAPRPLQQVIPHVDIPLQQVKIIHSGQFRDLQDLFPDHKVNGKNILIIGGSNSAGEGAGVIAAQLSNTQNAVDGSLRATYKDTRIIHVTPRPLYALPPYLPSDEHSQAYMPLDFQFYNLAKRLPGPIVGAAGLATKAFIDLLHSNIQNSLGGDQTDLGAPALVAPGADLPDRRTVQAALTESYSEYVRSGIIEVIRGKVTSISTVDSSTVVEVETSDGKVSLQNIGAIVYATGYTPLPALDMLDDKTRTALQYDGNSMRLPLILEHWQTSAPAVPSLALHGFYEGPYWGIMEMQARITASRWLGKDIPPRNYEQADDLLNLRKAMHERRFDVPQYWLGDYTGYMEEIAEVLDLERNDAQFGEREGAVVAARYSAPGDDRIEASNTMKEFHALWTACQNGRFVARAVMRALQGEWEIVRDITSRRSAFPSGILTGTASFSPRFPTSKDSAFDLEYLYVETGVFRTTIGFEMNATRRYVYRYSEVRDELSVWFVKPESQYEVDYLFHNLTFSKPEVSKVKGATIAIADHLCIKDMYKTEYNFPMKGVALPSFTMEHEVQGPEKDYTATTTFRRRVRQ